jgi:low affinity Fe/Cu permease
MAIEDLAITDVTTITFMKWDLYKDKKPDEALPAIYAYTTETAKQISDWYWANIGTKRVTSLSARGIAFSLLLVGTSLQIYATTLDIAAQKLLSTQLALAAIAIAALVQLADKIFGWSSGWMRYITTVTTMENLIRVFQLEWAKFIVSKTTPLDISDTKALFDLAQKLEQEILKLQADETTKWVSEFNTGISILDAAIKSQREDTEKKLDAIRITLASQDAATKADEKGKVPGGIEVNFSYKTEAKKVQVSIDNGNPEEILGASWSKLGVAPGQHTLKAKLLSDPPYTVEKIVEVKAGAVERPEIRFPI